MKKINQSKKLQLSTDTIRVLVGPELDKVAGGSATPTCLTRITGGSSCYRTF